MARKLSTSEKLQFFQLLSRDGAIVGPQGHSLREPFSEAVLRLENPSSDPLREGPEWIELSWLDEWGF